MKKGYIIDLEKSTLQNTDYRRVLYTSKYCQLVLMNIPPQEEIGQETHDLDQFIRFESGTGLVEINQHQHIVGDGMAVIIPAHSQHNVINTSQTQPLKLYSIYTPPEHKDGTLHPTKADEKEEHFDGHTSE